MPEEKKLENFTELKFEAPEQWPEQVEFVAVLKEVNELIKKFVSMKGPQRLVVSQWAVSTWFVDHLDYLPYLLITSPTKRCGKTKLMKVLAEIVRFPVMSGDLTAAATFRVMAKDSPTLLMDEADRYLNSRFDFASILNCGNSRDGRVLRTAINANGNYGGEIVAFSCFGFKAIAGIKASKISDTLTDRSIVIELVRKTKQMERCRLKQFKEQCETLRRKLFTLVQQHGADVAKLINKGDMVFPDELNDRQVDNIEPLWAIAECCADPRTVEKIKEASRRVLTKTEALSQTEAVRLLRDVWVIVKNYPQTSISTEDLLRELRKDPAWIELSAKKLSLFMGEFEIKSFQNSQLNNKRCYRVQRVIGAYKRYR